MRTKLTRSTGNVFRDAGFSSEEAHHLRIRSGLMAQLVKLIRSRRLTQAQAAKSFGVTQPRISNLVRGKIELFSIDTLVLIVGAGSTGIRLLEEIESRAHLKLAVVGFVDDDPGKIGLGITVFVSIETGDHSQEWLNRFAELVGAMPEVMEFYRMAGDVDYMLRVVVPDIAGYDTFYKKLIGTVPLKNVTSRFAMERIKSTTALPIR